MLQPGESRKKFPDLLQAIGVLLALLAVELLIGAAYYDFVGPFPAGEPVASGVVALIANGLIISAVMSYRRLSFARLLHDGASSPRAVLVLLTLPIALLFGCGMVLLDDLMVLIERVFPMSQGDLDMFQRLMSSGMASLITVCVIAPVIEEILFRGIFLRSFLQQYSARQAIVFSSLLFAIAHLNIYQGVPAFFIGLMIGWIYWRVQSLWPCIVAHMACNLSGYVVNFAAGDAVASSMAVEFAPLPIQLAAVIGTIVGGNLLWKLLGPRPASAEAPAE